MRKIRSKLKRKSTNQKWKRGHSSTSNPTKTTHRDKARAKFLNVTSNSALTTEAVTKLNKLQSKTNLKQMDQMTVDSEDDQSKYSAAPTTTVRSFMSSFSTHTNASFSKLLDCENLNERRKEMVAVLAASTETIKEQQGGETSTEYFLAFINSLAILDEVDRADPIVGLLNLVIKSVPAAVMQDKFTLARGVFLKLMETFEKHQKQAGLIDVIACTASLLSAQEFSKWSHHGTTSLLEAMLSFATHSKPKIRKGAVKSVTYLLKNCMSNIESNTEMKDVHHPVSKKVANYSLEYFTASHLDNNAVTVLHILGLIENCFVYLHTEDIKLICEGLLSLSTASNPLIRMHCYQAFYGLFESEHCGCDKMIGQLIAAIFDMQPDISDVRQTIAWVTVLKKGYVCLSKKNKKLCSDMVLRFMQICIDELWSKDQGEINATVTSVIKEMLVDVISNLTIYKKNVLHVVNYLTAALKNPFAACHKQAIILFSKVYEILGPHFGPELKESLVLLANRYNPNGTDRREIENTILSAIKYVDIAILLAAIPLTDKKGDISIERSWMLPLLREGLRKSSLEYFHVNIIPLASHCLKKWKDFEAAGKTSDAHIYELLCCQLWGLFPGFCRQPVDAEKFSLIARTAGTILSENLYLRAPILDGFKELIPSVIADDKTECISKYSKNYLPILFNLYISKPKGSYENDLRVSILDIIKLFLKITAEKTLNEMFNTSLTRLKSTKQGEFAYNMLFDIVECFSIYLKPDQLKVLYEQYVKPILTVTEPKKVQPDTKKAYRILCNILGSANENCTAYVLSNFNEIENLMLKSEQLNGDNIMLTRLRCLKLLMERQSPKLDSDIMRQCISETVLCFPNQPEKPNPLCTEMIKIIGTHFNASGKIDEFIELLLIGITSESLDLIIKSIWSINSVLQFWSNELNEDTINFILENIFASVQSNHRMEVKAALCTLYTFCKFIPRAHLTTHLETLVKTMSKMIPDTKRFCRIAYGRLLKKLCQYYSVVEITRLVPGNDLVTHKRLKKIRKDLNKTKNQKGTHDKEESDDESEINQKLKTITIDDVLKDSDSDFEDSESEEEINQQKANNKKDKMEVCIREDGETIVDLTDINAINKISMKNKKKKSGKIVEAEQDEDDKITFKTAADGRLIIEEPKRTKKEFMKSGVKRQREADSDDSASEEEISNNSGNKKLKGIHRSTNSSMSVISGKTGKSFKSNKSSKSVMSKASKKQTGPKKGKMQPYAYIPLHQLGQNKKKKLH